MRHVLLAVALASVCLLGCNDTIDEPIGFHPILKRELGTLDTSGHLTYRVKAGDTLWSISRRFGTTVSAMIEANGVKKTSGLEVGQVLSIPLINVSKSSGRPTKGFVWPVRGEVVVAFGQHREGLKSWGVDIRTKRGEPVLASSDGVVRKAGRFVGLGQTVVIKHTDGMTVTFYGRNGALSVSEGETVSIGQEIAHAPAISAERPIIHFRMYRGRKPVDPLKYLP